MTRFLCFCSSGDWIWGLAQTRQTFCHWAVLSASSNIFVWGVPTKKERTCFHSFPESLHWLDSPKRDYKTQYYFCLSKADWTGVPKALTFLLAVYNSSASSAPKPCIGYGAVDLKGKEALFSSVISKVSGLVTPCSHACTGLYLWDCVWAHVWEYDDFYVSIAFWIFTLGTVSNIHWLSNTSFIPHMTVGSR